MEANRMAKPILKLIMNKNLQSMRWTKTALKRMGLSDLEIQQMLRPRFYKK